MRKEYLKPLITVVEIVMAQRLLAGSTPGFGGGGSSTPEAREDFYFDGVE